MKYFYTDALAAAWMADKFGMVLNFDSCLEGGTNKSKASISYQHFIDNEKRFYKNKTKYYIHPDSLHLLEPQVGDVAKDSIDTIGIYEGGKDFRIIEIIQRNNIAFMTPESEE